MKTTGQTQSEGKAGIAASVEKHLRAYFAAHEEELPAAGLYGRVIQEVEAPLLRLVMQACNGNQLRAADVLGLNRNTLRKKLRDHGLIEVRTVPVRRGRRGR